MRTDPDPKLRSLGHVVLNVTSLARSVPYYTKVLGLRPVGRLDRKLKATVGDIVFLSFGNNHHDVGLREVATRAAGGAVSNSAPGLFHVAFSIGTTLDELRSFKRHLGDLGVTILRVVDHRVCQSIYFLDPDGIVIEAYVGIDPGIGADDTSYVATSQPLQLD